MNSEHPAMKTCAAMLYEMLLIYKLNNKKDVMYFIIFCSIHLSAEWVKDKEEE